MVEFSPDGYDKLLGILVGLGYKLAPASRVGREGGRVVFLRHDIDIHVEGAEQIARVEERHAARSTWYVLLDAHYNPGYPENRRALWDLVDSGHTLGLHYDLSQFGREADLYERCSRFRGLFGTHPASLTMHRPSAGPRDVFRRHPLNPHRNDIFYVSDSRREWTEPYLSTLLAGQPTQAMLCTHHEHWVNPVEHWDEMAAAARKPVDQFLEGERQAWIDGR